MSFISTFFEGLDHLVYPQACCACGSDVVKKSQILCPQCVAQLPLTNFGTRLDTPVEKVFRGRLPLVFATSFLYFTKNSLTQRMLHQLKYRDRKEIGVMLGRMMAESGLFSTLHEQVDILVPLPLHRRKEKKRGYNQAQMICDGIAGAANIPIASDAVIRRSVTSSQTHKNRSERWFNMSGRFELRNHTMIRNRHVLLVDDIITTGATLEACGLELLKAEGIKLSIASVAYTTL